MLLAGIDTVNKVLGGPVLFAAAVVLIAILIILLVRVFSNGRNDSDDISAVDSILDQVSPEHGDANAAAFEQGNFNARKGEGGRKAEKFRKSDTMVLDRDRINSAYRSDVSEEPSETGYDAFMEQPEEPEQDDFSESIEEPGIGDFTEQSDEHEQGAELEQEPADFSPGTDEIESMLRSMPEPEKPLAVAGNDDIVLDTQGTPLEPDGFANPDKLGNNEDKFNSPFVAGLSMPSSDSEDQSRVSNRVPVIDQTPVTRKAPKLKVVSVDDRAQGETTAVCLAPAKAQGTQKVETRRVAEELGDIYSDDFRNNAPEQVKEILETLTLEDLGVGDKAANKEGDSDKIENIIAKINNINAEERGSAGNGDGIGDEAEASVNGPDEELSDKPIADRFAKDNATGKSVPTKPSEQPEGSVKYRVPAQYGIKNMAVDKNGRVHSLAELRNQIR